MMISKRSRAIFAGAALLGGLLASQLAPSAVHAQVGACRSDPVVTLWNLGALDLSANIGDSVSDVKSVNYVVHIPAGLRVAAIVNTSGLIGPKETIHVYADDAANTFDTYTTVYTGTSGVTVSASSAVVSLLNLTLGLGSASGKSGQALHMRYTALVTLL